MKKISLLLIYLFIYYLPCQSQAVNIKGKIIDANTNQPIPIVSITLENGTKGTISNELGQFQLSMDSLPNTINFLHVAYKTQSYVVRQGMNTEIVIQLKPAIRILKPVVIDARFSEDFAEKLLLNVLDKFKSNPNNYLANSFYRQKTKYNGLYNEVLESFYNTTISTRGVKTRKIVQGRYARRNIEKDELNFYFENFSYLVSGFRLYQSSIEKTDLVVPVIAEVLKYYELAVEEYIDYEDKVCAVVECKAKDKSDKLFLEGLLYIDTVNFNILKIEGQIDMKDKGVNVKFNNNEDPNNGYSANTVLKFDVSTKSINNNTLIDYIRATMSFNVLKKDNVNFKDYVEIDAFWINYDYQNNKKEKEFEVNSKEMNDLDMIKKIRYKPSFWKDNPIILRTPIEEEVISDFEKSGAFGNMIEDEK